MKTEFTDVSETRKTITIEIPTDVVDAEINRIAKDYTKQARIPGFRPGKVPTGLVKKRFKEQILHDVAHGLIPRAVDEALQERGIAPIDTPNIRDVALEEGQPLKFTAAIETVPPFDVGDLSTIEATRHASEVTDETVEKTLQNLRQRGAKFEPVEDRGVQDGDTVVLDIERKDAGDGAQTRDGAQTGTSDRHENVSLELGSPANPPGFDAQLVGLRAGETKTFTIHFPEDYTVKEMANTDVEYTVTVKDLRRKVLPALDDEFAKDVGAFESLTALRDQVRADLQEESKEHARQHLRTDILKQLSERVTFELPASLVEREMDRRLEEFASRLMQQNVDPRQAGIDWGQFRESQRDPARASVASALALDEIARREGLTVTAEEVDKEIERFAARAGRTPAALRAQLEKEGSLTRLATGLRREKAVDLVLSRARIH
jgi:trigger factor